MFKLRSPSADEELYLWTGDRLPFSGLSCYGDDIQVTNAYVNGELVGSIVVRSDLHEQSMFEMHGPYFGGEGRPRVLQSIFIVPDWRGSGLFSRFIGVLGAFNCPLYAELTDNRLVAHFERYRQGRHPLRLTSPPGIGLS